MWLTSTCVGALLVLPDKHAHATQQAKSASCASTVPRLRPPGPHLHCSQQPEGVAARCGCPKVEAGPSSSSSRLHCAAAAAAAAPLGSSHYKKRRDAPATIACLYIYPVYGCACCCCALSAAATRSDYLLARCLHDHSSSLLCCQLLLLLPGEGATRWQRLHIAAAQLQQQQLPALCLEWLQQHSRDAQAQAQPIKQCEVRPVSICLQGPQVWFCGVDETHPREEVTHRQTAPRGCGCVRHKQTPKGEQVLADGGAHGGIGEARLQDCEQLGLVRNGGNPDLQRTGTGVQTGTVSMFGPGVSWSTHVLTRLCVHMLSQPAESERPDRTTSSASSKRRSHTVPRV